MAINRRFLYAGLFLVALGGVLVLVDLAAVDTAALSSALRLWPLAIIAIGAGIVLRRSRYALVAGVLAAMVPGLVLGGGLAVAPRYPGDCGAREELSQTASQSGTFNGAADVSLGVNCGSIAVTTTPGNAWQLTAQSTMGQPPVVTASERSLRIASIGHEDWEWLDEGRDALQVSLPAAQLGLVSLDVNAGHADVALPGATLDVLSVTGNGAEIQVDVTEAASLPQLNATLNFGMLSIHLPAGTDVSGEIRIAAGELTLCTQPGDGLRLDIAGSAREVHVGGLRFDERIYESDGYAQAQHRTDLSVRVNFGTIEINPIGGCK
jgi:hypothetical protein